MKLKKFILSLAMGLGIFLLGGQVVHAAIVEPINGIYHSDGQARPIYADPDLKNATGRTLATNVNQWRTFEISKDGNTILAYNLGKNQWVAAMEITSNLNDNQIEALEVFSDGKTATIYDDPFTMNHAMGTLNPKIQNWKVTKVAYTNRTIDRVDLGNNQWVFLGNHSGLTLIHQTYSFLNETQLYNQSGQPTGKIHSEYLMAYRVLGTKKINHKIYICLGDSNQWVPLAKGIF